MNTPGKPYFSDLSTKGLLKTSDVFLPSDSDPLALFHALRSKGTNPGNPTNPPEAAEPGPALPEAPPVVTPEAESRLANFYASRPRAERLAMNRRSVYVRAERGWDWPACDLTAWAEAWEAAGRPPGPFSVAADGIVFTDQRNRPETEGDR